MKYIELGEEVSVNFGDSTMIGKVLSTPAVDPVNGWVISDIRNDEIVHLNDFQYIVSRREK